MVYNRTGFLVVAYVRENGKEFIFLIYLYKNHQEDSNVHRMRTKFSMLLFFSPFLMKMQNPKDALFRDHLKCALQNVI